MELQIEINIISAEALKPPSFNLNRRLKTYAVIWVDPLKKLRTTIDDLGGPNPNNWGNNKFVTTATKNDFVNVAIYAVGILKDRLIGTARIPVSTIVSSSGGGFSLSSFPVTRKGKGDNNTSCGIVKVGAQVVLLGRSRVTSKMNYYNGISWVIAPLHKKFSALTL